MGLEEDKIEESSISHSQSEPVSLQPRSSKAKTTTTSNLLLQTVPVIKPESSALMQECSDEEDMILAHSGRFCQKMFQRHEKVQNPQFLFNQADITAGVDISQNSQNYAQRQF